MLMTMTISIIVKPRLRLTEREFLVCVQIMTLGFPKIYRPFGRKNSSYFTGISEALTVLRVASKPS